MHISMGWLQTQSDSLNVGFDEMDGMEWNGSDPDRMEWKQR